MNSVDEHQATALCVLGMHRSGTSTVARAVNLLGAYLGEQKDLGQANEDNPEGYWEWTGFTNLQGRLLAQFGRKWNSVAPLPEQWHASPDLGPYKEELKRLITANFAGHSLWAWKDPRSCLFMPLWREVLGELRTRLLCIFVVRSPLDVANSLRRRDGMPLGRAFGLWFNYNLAALQGAVGVPTTFLVYDRLLESWEPELRRCASALGIGWPADEERLKEAMNAFIRPNLRHSKTTLEDLRGAPEPVRELYAILLDVLAAQTPPDGAFYEKVNRLAKDFYAYASLFEGGLDDPSIPPVGRPPYLQRTWWRWKRSIRKRLPARKA